MREPKLLIATGGKGVGKTFTTCTVISKYIRSNPETGKKGRKVLIFDVNEEYSNEELKRHGHRFQTKLLAADDIEKYTKQKTPEVRRILPRDKNGKLLDLDGMVDLLNRILHYYRGGLLVVEDINRYMTDTKSKEIIGVMATNRHRDLDIYIHLQSLSPVTTRMWQNCACVRFHKQLDDVARYKNRLPIAEMYFIAQTLVGIQYKINQRFYCYVDNEKSQIYGKFSKRSFMIACYNYLMNNPNEMNKYYPRFGGKKNHNQAVAFAIQDLTSKYYGNEN